MLRIEFTNAVVKDSGYGLEVNGKDLSEIISTALGTRVGNKGGYGSGLPSFSSNSCNVVVIIQPNPVQTHIETDDEVYKTVEELVEEAKEKYEQYQAENGTPAKES